jgi:hypothetical protein
MSTEQTEKEKFESRTEMMLEGSLIESVNISPTGIRIYRKGGGIIDATPRRAEASKPPAFSLEFINKAS